MEKMKNVLCDCIERKVLCNCFESFSSNVNAHALSSESAKEAPINQLGKSLDPNESVMIPPLPDMKTYTWDEIFNSIENGDQQQFLGQGGFGSVYGCNLLDIKVAVKIQREGGDQTLLNDEFSKEILVVKGTRGWIAPETENDSIVSTKSDVYSYGVFLLHLYTGRKPYDEKRSPQKLADWFLEKAYGREEYERKIVDAALGDMYSLEDLTKIFAIAVKCIDANRHVRPTMNEVVEMVREASNDQPHQHSPVTERIF